MSLKAVIEYFAKPDETITAYLVGHKVDAQTISF